MSDVEGGSPTTGPTARDALAALVGVETGNETVCVERGPVAFFAEAVLDHSPEYRRPDAAAAAGFDAIPAPPTYLIALSHWGGFEELQTDESSPGVQVALGLARPHLPPGGLLLHGEQEFEYRRPILVGDVLVGTSRIAQIYSKESKGNSMTFLVCETAWTDQRTREPVAIAQTILIWRVRG